MRTWLLLNRGMGLALAGIVAPALAAPTAVPDDEIVVTGERLSPAQARKRAIAYVQHSGIVTGKPSVARWIDPVCPRAIGLPAEHARLVESRLRTIAGEVGVPTAKSACTANITVNFVGEGSGFVRSVAARSRRALAEVPPNVRPALMSGSAPIRWWYSTEVRGREGGNMVGAEPPHVRIDGGMAGQALQSNGETTSLQQYNAGLISTYATRALRSATVVVDTVRADGTTLDAIADYAALVAFAEVLPRETPFPGSILGLFGGEPARALTKLDVAFLRELYSLPLDRKARQQRGRLVRALQNEQGKF